MKLPPDKGYMGDRKRGAGLGRPTRRGDPTLQWRFFLRCVPVNRSGYDSGGAYWGIGAPLYWYAAYGDEAPMFSGPLPEGFIRAPDRDDAKRQIWKLYPEARFFR